MTKCIYRPINDLSTDKPTNDMKVYTPATFNNFPQDLVVVSFDKLEQLCSVSVRDRNILSSMSFRLYSRVGMKIYKPTKIPKTGFKPINWSISLLHSHLRMIQVHLHLNVKLFHWSRMNGFVVRLFCIIWFVK